MALLRQKIGYTKGYILVTQFRWCVTFFRQKNPALLSVYQKVEVAMKGAKKKRPQWTFFCTCILFVTVKCGTWYSVATCAYFAELFIYCCERSFSSFLQCISWGKKIISD